VTVIFLQLQKGAQQLVGLHDVPLSVLARIDYPPVKPLGELR
jgi:hypothetical protein